jgi:hypothetical protein
LNHACRQVRRQQYSASAEFKILRGLCRPIPPFVSCLVLVVTNIFKFKATLGNTDPLPV